MPFLPKGFEWIIILIVVLIIFGPKNLPKLGAAMGRAVKGLREGMGSRKKKGATVAVKPAETAEQLPAAEAPKLTTGEPSAVEKATANVEAAQKMLAQMEAEKQAAIDAELKATAAAVAAETESAAAAVEPAVEQAADAAPKAVKRIVVKKKVD